MNTTLRKRSPRAPSIPLGDAIEKASKIYDKDRCHAAPANGAAQHIGYKDAGNGAALSTMASLRYYGLLERPKDGMVAVSKDIEAFKFAPSDDIRQAIVIKWLRSPPIFAELLEKYAMGLPSDATLKFELIQKGFAPAAADQCLQVFRRSVDFARYFEQPQSESPEESEFANIEEGASDTTSVPDSSVRTPASINSTSAQVLVTSNDVDRIPVRLAGGRRAWIEIPMPFYEADKDRLKKQIDLLLTNDDEDDDSL